MATRFEVFQDRSGEWRWRLRHRNGEIVADSAEGSPSRDKCVRSIAAIKRSIVNAEAEAPGGRPQRARGRAATRRSRTSKPRSGLTRRTLAKNRKKKEEARVGEPQIGPRLNAAG